MKQGEIDYLRLLGDAGTKSAFNKPFSQLECGKNLVDMGLILSLLPPAPSRVLDLGCGTGWTSWFMANRGHQVVGQDISSDMIELARRNGERFAAGNTTFVLSDYEALDFHEEFDAALFYDSLHHAEDEALAIDRVYRALKPGGVLVTHEPGAGHSKSAASLEAMRLYGVNEKDMPPSRIFALGRKSGFSSCRRLLDPTALLRAVYQTNVETGRPERGIVRRARTIAGLLRRIVNNHAGAICVLQK
jgi:SAM-dependent methyltransferase